MWMVWFYFGDMMRYTYSIFNEDGTRVNTCTRFQEAVQYDIKDHFYIVSDNLVPSNVDIKIMDEDGVIGWWEKIGRDSAWLNRPPEKKFDFLKDEDGFHATTDEKFVASVQEFTKKVMDKLPDSNLKTAAAVGKPTFSPIPPVAMMALGAAMQDGVNKYGLFNWRDSAVTSTVFYDAILRHLFAWYSGEREAPDSKIHHLAHAMAGCAILLDAEYNMRLNDDRKAGKAVTPDTMGFIKNGNSK